MAINGRPNATASPIPASSSTWARAASKSDFRINGPLNAGRKCRASGSTSPTPNVPSTGASRNSTWATPISERATRAFVNNGSGSLSRTLVFRHSGRGARPFDRRQLRRRQSGLLPSETGRGFQSARRIDHPEIGAVSQELVDEVAVRSVKLNAIEPSVYRIESSPPEILHHVSDLIQR